MNNKRAWGIKTYLDHRYSFLFLRRVLTAILASVCLGFLIAPSFAKEPPKDPQQRYQEAFEAMMADLANPERSFEFVQAAVDVGDLRGAIAALERILLIDPKLSNIKLELGVLYLRAGLPELAVGYIDQALNDPNMPPLVRVRAEALFDRAKAGARRQLFFAMVGVSARYESNANAGPDFPLVKVGGIDARLEDRFTKQADFSLNLSAALQHRYAFESQAGHQLETDLFLFGSEYRDFNAVETMMAELRIGPRFYGGRTADPSSSLRPYLLGSYLFLADERYLVSAGGGLDAEIYLTGSLRGEIGIEYRNQRYHDSDRNPNASSRTGSLGSGSVGVVYQAAMRTALGTKLLYEQASARTAFDQYRTIGATFFLAQQFASPFDLTLLPWALSAMGTFRRSKFDEPDPSVDPDVTREDDRTDYGLNLTARLSRRSDLLLVVQYTDRESNLPNFTYDNLAVSLGAQYRY